MLAFKVAQIAGDVIVITAHETDRNAGQPGDLCAANRKPPGKGRANPCRYESGIMMRANQDNAARYAPIRM